MGNRLTKIYTRTGDAGDTGLADGSRTSKNAPRIHAYGDLDELNSQIGLLLTFPVPEPVRECLSEIQQTLFDLGGDLCIPGRSSIGESQVQWLENWLDHFNEQLPPLADFILPGGNGAAALLPYRPHRLPAGGRTVVALAQAEEVPPTGLAYINRLSDLLFVLARVLARMEGGTEVLWQPRRPARSRATLIHAHGHVTISEFPTKQSIG